MYRLKLFQGLAAFSAQKRAPLQQSMLGFLPTRHYGEDLNPVVCPNQYASPNRPRYQPFPSPILSFPFFQPANPPPDAMERDKFRGNCLSKETREHEHNVEYKVKKHHYQPLSRPVDLDIEFDRPMQPTSMEEVWREREPSQRQPNVVVDLDPEFDRDDPEAVDMKTLYPDARKEEEEELEEEGERMEEEGGVVVEKK